MSYGRRINQGGYPVTGDRGEAGGVLKPKFYNFVAAGGQTAFGPMAPFQPGFGLVYAWKNSEFLIPGVEFVETSDTTILLTGTEPCELGDKLNVIVFYLSASAGGPLGPAGGVLAGSYPNPGFAVPMATYADLVAAINTRALLAHRHDPSDLNSGGATDGQVLGWSATLGMYVPIDQTGGPGPSPTPEVTLAMFNQAIGALFMSLQGKQDIAAAAAATFTPKVISCSNLTSTTQTVAGGTRTYIDYNIANSVNSDTTYLGLTKNGLESRFAINVPASKRVWWRFTATVLIDQSTGSNNGHIIGCEQIRQGTLATDFNIQLGAMVSPVANYATVPTGSVVGSATYPVYLVPWIFPLYAARLQTSTATGFAANVSLEIIAEKAL